MLTEPVTRNESAPPVTIQPPDEDRALRELAIKQVERIRTSSCTPLRSRSAHSCSGACGS